MKLKTYQVPAHFFIKFKIKNAPIVLRDPSMTDVLKVLNGEEYAQFKESISPDHIGPNANPQRPQERDVILNHIIRSWLVKVTEPATHRDPNLEVEFLQVTILGLDS